MFEKASCWINGKVVAPSEASVSIFDHGFLYGDGVFEGVRFYRRNCFRLPRHLKRLQDSAAALQLKLPYSLEEIAAAIDELLQQGQLEDGYLRILVTRGVGALGINPVGCTQPQLIIISAELTMISDEKRAAGATTIIASTRRNTADRLDPRIKSMNYLNAIFARMEANFAGVDEAILLNDRGNVTEGSADNLFIVRDNVLLTPPCSEGALSGITRGTVLELAQQEGIEAREAILSPYDLYCADECFLTGTGARLIPVREVDGRPIRVCPGPVYQQLENAFKALIARETA